MSEEEKGFTIRDKRAFTGEEAKEAEDAAKRDSAGEGKSDKVATESGKASRRPLPPVEFSGFLLSLSHAALMHLGQIPDPQTGKVIKDKDFARHTIDTIAMLKTKTEGNLSQDEKQLMDNILTELRLQFVRLSEG